MCLYPRLLPNPRYRKNKKNGGQLPPVTDKRVLLVPVGCQICIECRQRKGNQWKTRLMEEVKHDNTGKFVTLTFSPESLKELDQLVDTNKTGYDRDNETARIATRRYFERIRKETGKSLKHWLIPEIGGKNYEGLHLHGIIFTNNVKLITEKWTYGYMYIGQYVNEKTVNYIIKYVTKLDIKHKQYIPQIFTSKGIGKQYTLSKQAEANKFQEEKTITKYRLKDGKQATLPDYYKSKLYTDEQKEKLWIHKLNEQKRYILGIKVDISQGEEQYFRGLKTAQQNNIEMGYPKPDWEHKEYENKRRQLKQQQKINKDIKKKNNNNKN